MAQVYYSPMTVGAAQVPSTQTDFPKLSYPTDNRFKTIGNGGHVANANGYDIRPYSDAALTTPLTYELVYYNASTGQFEMHVKIPSLSNGYVTYFGYGDASLTTDGSSTSTWSNNFLAVHHLKDGTTLSVAPSCVSTNIGTNHGATATAGEIDGGAALVSASSQYIDITDVVTLNPSAITISIWVNGTSFPNAYNSTIVRNTTGSNAFIYVKSTGKLACGAVAGGSGGATQKIYDGTGSHTLSTGTWYYLVMTYDSSTGLIGYVNAASDGTDTASSTLNTGGANTALGNTIGVPSRFWDGKLDEARMASVARSADWITTEYNNQSAPGTFETLGTEVPVSAVTFSGLYTI